MAGANNMQQLSRPRGEGRRDKNGKDPILSIPLERLAENVKLRGAIVYREIGKSYLKLMIKPKILSVLTFQIQFGFWKIWDQPITCLIISQCDSYQVSRVC